MRHGNSNRKLNRTSSHRAATVSYTHLDVYKRQIYYLGMLVAGIFEIEV